EPPPEVAPDDLGDGAEVIVAPIPLDAEAAVLALVGLAVLEHDGAADDLAALRMRDVEADHQPRHDLQVQRLLEVVEDVVGPLAYGLGQHRALLEQVARVLVGELDEPHLLASRGDVGPDPRPGPFGQHLLDERPGLELQREQHFPRQVARALLAAAEVQPRNTRGEERRVILGRRVLEEVHLAAQQLPVPDPEADETRVVAVRAMPMTSWSPPRTSSTRWRCASASRAAATSRSRAARSNSSASTACCISSPTRLRTSSTRPLRTSRISSTMARYSASDWSPAPGALQRPMG